MIAGAHPGDKISADWDTPQIRILSAAGQWNDTSFAIDPSRFPDRNA